MAAISITEARMQIRRMLTMLACPSPLTRPATLRRCMSFVRLAPLALLALGACASRPGGNVPSSTGDQLVAVARTQEAAWNRGDLEGFMSAGYLRSEKLTFFSGGSVSHGYDAMLARYKKSYQSDGKEMGQLSFSALEAVPLDPDNAIVRTNLESVRQVF